MLSVRTSVDILHKILNKNLMQFDHSLGYQTLSEENALHRNMDFQEQVFSIELAAAGLGW